MIAILCLLVEISQRQLLKSNLINTFYSSLLHYFSYGFLEHQSVFFHILIGYYSKTFQKSFINQFSSIWSFLSFMRIFIGKQQFMMIAIKIFMTFSTAVAIFYIIIVALFFDTYLVSTTKNLEMVTTLHLIKGFSLSIVFNIDGRLSLVNQNPALVGMQFLFAALIAINLLIKAITTKNQLLISTYLIVLTILAVAMSFTGTRTALISLLVISIVCPFIALFSKRTNKIVIASAFLVFSALNIAATFLNTAAVNRNLTTIIYIADKFGLIHLPNIILYIFLNSTIIVLT